MNSINYDIVLLGSQGSGKGTQGRILAERYGLPFFEMGAYLRKIVAEGSLGSSYTEHISRFIKSGNLVPDAEINEIIRSFILQHGNQKIIFDGVCRTLNQKEAFTKLMYGLGRKFVVIYIHLERKDAIERLIGRRICTVCKTTYPSSYKGNLCSYLYESGIECGGKLTRRQDDGDELAIQKRLDSFFDKTTKSIESFREDGNLIEVEGDLSVEEVTTAINTGLKSLV